MTSAAAVLKDSDVPAGAHKTKYASTVTQVGSIAADFRAQGLIIFFGTNAPEELHEFSVLHQPSVHAGGICVGDEIVLAGHRLAILAVGSVANDNLVNLGHLDLKANGESVPPLPGDVCVGLGDLPELEVGDVWSIESPGDSGFTETVSKEGTKVP